MSIKGGILKTYLEIAVSIVLVFIVLSAAPPTARAQQAADERLAIVDGRAITPQQLKPFLPPDFDSLRPDQAAVVRSIALENAILDSILGAEARRRGISIRELRKRMTRGPLTVTDTDIEGQYRENASFFGLMSPHEAKTRLGLVLEAEQRMKLFRSAMVRLRKAAKVTILPGGRSDVNVELSGKGPSLGPADASITISIFSDFQCPYCRSFQAVLARLRSDYPSELRIVFKNLPVARPGKWSAAAVGVCADEQGRFWEFHDAAYASDVLTPVRLQEIATQIGLDRGRLDDCLSSESASNTLNRDIEEARRLGIRGTPTFILNGKIYTGMLTLAEMKEIVERELKSVSQPNGR